MRFHLSVHDGHKRDASLGGAGFSGFSNLSYLPRSPESVPFSLPAGGWECSWTPAKTLVLPARLSLDSLGQSSWALLHSAVAAYPRRPTRGAEKDMENFFSSLSRVFPCRRCGVHFQWYMGRHPPDFSSQANLSQWLCEYHNAVNRRTGKPEFDCGLIDARWGPPGRMNSSTTHSCRTGVCNASGVNR
eukprot:Rmarinus@m.6313